MTKAGPCGTRKALCYGLAFGVPAAIGGLLFVTRLGEGIGALLLPVIVFAYLGGLRPGLIATVTATGAAVLLLEAPGTSGAVLEVLRVGTVGLIGAAISVACHALHEARDRAERTRRTSTAWERRFTRTFEASPAAMALSRLDDRTIVIVNDAFVRAFELDRAELIGRTPQQVGLLALVPEREQLLGELRQGLPLENVEITVDSRRGPKTVLLSSQVIDLDGVPHALSTFLDISERRRAEESARASYQQFRELAESIHGVFWLTDPCSAAMHYVSPGYERVFGRRVDALYLNASDWLEALHPDDRARVSAAVKGGMSDLLDDQFRIVLPDGKIRWIRVKLFPIRDHRGSVIRTGGMAEDITHHRELEEQVRQTQKLESLGLLAGGVAHDFNNILAVVGANIGLLGETVAHDHPDHELVDEIEAAVVRATALTRQLLAFSRKQSVEAIVLDLNTAVNETRKMLRRMVGEDIVITSSLEPELQHVRIDPGYLVQVLINLVVNARDAMPRGGELAITTRNIEVQGRREVLLQIADTGCGMTPELVKRVFEPFFTTKGVGRGTGLGLSVVHGIIEQAGGRVEIDSEVGVGTTFRILLPAIDAPIDTLTDLAEVGAPGTERILLVDDDRFVRGAASRALRARGYTVFEAPDAQAALRVLRHHGEHIALMVTDIVMPGMDGTELASVAQHERPELKVLFTSGYTDDSLANHGLKSRERAFLEKPFRTHTLAGKVRQLLDAR